MTYQISVDSNISVNPILKPANPVRGAGFRDLAMTFVKMYPIGSVLTAAELDDFAINQGGVEPPKDTAKGSDGWLAFLQRRHQFKVNLNKAGSHTDMADKGSQPFYVNSIGMNAIEVCTPFKAATAEGKLAVMRQLETLVKTKKTRLQHLIQSVDYTELPPVEQVRVLMLAEHIGDFEERINREIGDLDRKFYAVKSGINALLLDGKILPKNGGIKALVAPEADTLDEE